VKISRIGGSAVAPAGRLAVIVVTIALAGLAGCRTTTIQDVTKTPLGAAPRRSVSLGEVAKAIHAAGTDLGWVMQDVRPGELVGTLNLRKHVAVVTIVHDTSTFDIRYKSSQNLMHQGNEIHRKYNLWVQNLARRIQQEMAR
jgi:hypothetical protein